MENGNPINMSNKTKTRELYGDRRAEWRSYVGLRLSVKHKKQWKANDERELGITR
jgi:hypothetical protein